ncbi:SMP-30/gluconolactonase/LRE family protein [Chelatococcus reniformis]|uniref:Strictosidine synthase conserved region domain-containing protein n=1 Tax=Chelatococcus reniformis TaxID=1494448 RepID=A0A916TWR8_9HYPH|nr:SMP-30/gluconolactonase/LRE family protein [Chelatococcus reniformis]GGC48135.1 hypothetical protein GCM10010994_04100 [Chelatococcus reniformis]
MAFYSHFLRNMEQIFFPDRDQHAIPSMDGALSPNGKLDAFTVLLPDLTDVDDVAVAPDGLYVSAGRQVVHRFGPGLGQSRTLASFDAAAGALALHPDGRLLVCVAGKGLAAIGTDGGQRWLTEAEGQPLACLTGVAAAPDGTIVLTDGSSRHRAADWCRDLMEKNAAGRLIVADAGLATARVVRGGLAYPHGCAFSADGRQLWFTESWMHRVSRCASGAGGLAAPEVLIPNLPGYPARLTPAAAGGFWLPLFALRTHLVELVLRDDDFRRDMMLSIAPELWIAPQYASGKSYLEPLQGGGMRKLGILKPWAPPRSYGFVGRIGDDGRFLDSVQSRAGGDHHGIVRAIEPPQGLVVVSKAMGQLLQAPAETRQ